MTHISCDILTNIHQPLQAKCKENSKDGKDGKDGKEDMTQALLPLTKICKQKFYI